MKFSVIVCVFNGESTIDLAIQSVLAASRSDIEIVVVDDASTDGTHDKLVHYGNSIRVLRNGSNIGHARTWGVALAAATGEFIVKLDADDWLLPNYFERVDSILDERVGMVIPTVFDYAVKTGLATLRPVAIQDTELSAEQFRSRLLRRIFFRTPGLALRRSLTLQHAGPDPRVWHDDWEYFLRVTKGARVKVLSEPLAVYRIHGGSMSGVSRARNNMLRKSLTSFVRIVGDPSEEAYLEPGERRVFVAAVAKLYLRIIGSEMALSQLGRFPAHLRFALCLAASESFWLALPVAFFPILAVIERNVMHRKIRRFTRPIEDLVPKASVAPHASVSHRIGRPTMGPAGSF